MPIKVRPTGLTELYGKLGQLAGKAQQAHREEEQARAMERQILSYQHQREMAQYSAELNLAREKRTLERDLEAEERAHQWQLEKMEMSSRMDFAREEQRRQKKLDERQAKLDALEQAFKDGIIDEDDYQAAYLQEVTDIPFYAQQQITGRAAARPTTARVPSESQYAYLSSQGYSEEEIRGMFGLGAPGITAETLPTAGPTTAPTEPIPTIRTDADYNALSSGSVFIDPKGQIRIKP